MHSRPTGSSLESGKERHFSRGCIVPPHGSRGTLARWIVWVRNNVTVGYAVGMFADPKFVATRFRLTPGDTLVLYTDGLTEAQTGKGIARYDDDGALQQFAARHAPRTAPAVIEAISALLAGPVVDDDAAVLAMSMPR